MIKNFTQFINENTQGHVRYSENGKILQRVINLN